MRLEVLAGGPGSTGSAWRWPAVRCGGKPIAGARLPPCRLNFSYLTPQVSRLKPRLTPRRKLRYYGRSRFRGLCAAGAHGGCSSVG